MNVISDLLKKPERADSKILTKLILQLFILVKEEIDGAADPEEVFQNEI